MKLTAVILNYNDAEASVDAVRRIEGFSCVDRIVVVDNASTDNSAERIAEAFRLRRPAEIRDPDDGGRNGRITLLKAPRNGGYGYGNDLGIRYAADHYGAEAVLVANPDAVFEEGAVLRMLEALSADEDTAAVGAVMGEDDGGEIGYEEYLLSGWKFRPLWQEVLHSGPICKRLFRRWLDYPESWYRREGSAAGLDGVIVGAVHGSLLMLRTKHYLGVGGYDPGMFLYMEEYVLGCRFRKAGLKTVLLRERYRHEGSHSITGAGFGAVRRQQMRQASERIYYRDHLGAGPAAMALISLFQGIVLAETGAAVLLRKL